MALRLPCSPAELSLAQPSCLSPLVFPSRVFPGSLMCLRSKTGSTRCGDRNPAALRPARGSETRVLSRFSAPQQRSPARPSRQPCFASWPPRLLLPCLISPSSWGSRRPRHIPVASRQVALATWRWPGLGLHVPPRCVSAGGPGCLRGALLGCSPMGRGVAHVPELLGPQGWVPGAGIAFGMLWQSLSLSPAGWHRAHFSWWHREKARWTYWYE